MDNKRGFVTVATGKYYCRLAQNLAMSYRLFTNQEYPLCAITDKDGEKRLKKYYDRVVVLEEPSYSFLDKIMVYENTPYEETVFIDADMDATDDFSFLFDAFHENGSDISCIASFRDITDTNRPEHFGNAAIEHFKLDRYLAFNGGIYYFKKSKKSDDFFKLINDDLIPNYERYEMKEFRKGQKADEPLIGLAMVVTDMKPLSVNRDVMKLIQDMATVKWDMKNKKTSLIWYGKQVSPILLHYGTHNTRHKKYVYYNAIVRCKYHHISAMLPVYLLYSEARLGLLHLSRKEDRKALKAWFLDHFTKKHLDYRMSQIKSLFKR